MGRPSQLEGIAHKTRSTTAYRAGVEAHAERGYVEVDTMVRTREASVFSRNQSGADGSQLVDVGNDVGNTTLILALAVIAPSLNPRT